MESLRTIGIQVNLPVTVSICWRMKLRDMKNREKMLVLSSGNYKFLNGTNCTCNIFVTFRPSNFLSEISRMLVLALWKWITFCLWKEKFLYNEIFGDGSKNQKVLGKKRWECIPWSQACYEIGRFYPAISGIDMFWYWDSHNRTDILGHWSLLSCY